MYMLSKSDPRASSSAYFPYQQLVPFATTTSTVTDQSDRSSIKNQEEVSSVGKVVAGGAIPQNATTADIEPKRLAGNIDNEMAPVKVTVTPFGCIDLDENSKSLWTQQTHWVRAIKLADDCHGYNVQLRFHPSFRLFPSNLRAYNNQLPKIILQAIRPIEAGEELQMWFSEDVLATLQIAFLGLSNIRGENKYICSKCDASYESPNPLKLHMTLKCGKFDISALWQRLAWLMEGAPASDDNFEFKLNLVEHQVYKHDTNVLDLSYKKHESGATIGIERNNSAFKPFKREEMEINGNSPHHLNTQPLPQHLTSIPILWPAADVLQLHKGFMHGRTKNAQNDAQIESLVSSLGKARQGHICLYCGKCYSRKYGLKIHIRTHTGYKPLKCKFCERPFGDPSNLNKHVRLHAQGNTPYKCEICGKILVRRRDLERHLKSRHLADIHPGQNILEESPVNNNESSNSATESSEITQTQIDESSNSEVNIIIIAAESDNDSSKIC
ncbi:unnamed protein product [Ceutorhynchus assimilis]|uniref:C2H2-type domain-containing protein n=1 Tax=Ceutorhynchus assimilis TaxID=467358 RepID=A0A9N9MRD5_9CUCU|nr:unnamed protein product [Ceutorhynchus assimilis]